MDTRELVTLPNGARIAFDEMPALRTASVGVYLGAGARHEPEDRSGLAHFLEHMAFKGASGLNARQLAEAVEARGASINAATDHERTGYFVRCLSDDAPAMLDIALSMVFAPDHPVDEIEREKGVVLQEIGEAADQPDDLVFELAQAATYPDHALGRPILGVADTLRRVARDDLYGFASSAYVPSRTVVSVAGAFDRAAVEAAAWRWLQRHAPAPAIPSPEPRDISGGVRTALRSLEQLHIVLGRQAPSSMSEHRFAARVFTEIFGGGMASRLFQEVRESRGLAYTIYSSCDQYSDAGRFTVYAGCDAKDAREVVKITNDIWNDMAANGPTEEELARAKAVMAAQFAMAQEAPAARAGSAAYELLTFDQFIGFDEALRRIDSVTSQDVAAAAQSALAGSPVASAVGPKAGLAAAEAFVSGAI